MKLADIDVLVAHRKEFMARNDALCRVRTMSEHPGVTLGKSLYITDTDILTKVKALLIGELQKKYDEAKTKLMMLGVTEFPDVPTS